MSIRTQLILRVLGARETWSVPYYHRAGLLLRPLSLLNRREEHATAGGFHKNLADRIIVATARKFAALLVVT
ncbi:MAG: hypothetical protein H5U27_03655 [Methyloversatilis sp.]|nr:hypothetical protein [Methyloversatilis sp.]